jgi:hypothetical protein
MHSIPHEIRKIIALELPIRDYLNFAATCRQYYEENNHWSELCERDDMMDKTDKQGYIAEYLSMQHLEAMVLIEMEVEEILAVISTKKTTDNDPDIIYHMNIVLECVHKFINPSRATIIELCKICQSVEDIFVSEGKVIDSNPELSGILRNIICEYKRRCLIIFAKFIRLCCLEKVKCKLPDVEPCSFGGLLYRAVKMMLLSDTITDDQLLFLLDMDLFQNIEKYDYGWASTIQLIFIRSEEHTKKTLWNYLITKNKNMLYGTYFSSEWKKKHFRYIHKYIETNDYEGFIQVILSDPELRNITLPQLLREEILNVF